VVSVEEEPRIVELRGDRVNLVHHAYGANGIITEIEMPLAPAWAWREVIVDFAEFMTSVKFAHALATADGIVKKLISVHGAPIGRMMRAIRPFVHEGHSVVLCMIAAPFIEAFHALVKDFKGEVTSESAEFGVTQPRAALGGLVDEQRVRVLQEPAGVGGAARRRGRPRRVARRRGLIEEVHRVIGERDPVLGQHGGQPGA